jgi:hypothetical protein
MVGMRGCIEVTLPAYALAQATQLLSIDFYTIIRQRQLPDFSGEGPELQRKRICSI